MQGLNMVYALTSSCLFFTTPPRVMEQVVAVEVAHLRRGFVRLLVFPSAFSLSI